MRRVLEVLPLLAVVPALAAQVATGAEPGTATGGARAAEPARESITVVDLREHIEYLASDRLEGRAVGSRGLDRAGNHIAEHFRRAGLRRVARRGRSWFQEFTARTPRDQRIVTRNVLGLVEGTDDELREQVIVIGGHYDHVGVGRFGSRETARGSEIDDRIHNGADDNASGTAGVLELAAAFAESPPRRSLLFICFSAEELGLLGSRHYCSEPLIPLEHTVVMFNFDMIGRSEDDYLFLGGTGTSPVWDALINTHVESAGLHVERGAGGRAPSDNTPFYERDLPVLFFFTNVHVDYHRVSDEASFVNYGGAAKILRAAYELIRAIADADTPPPFQRADDVAMPASMEELMRTPSRARDLADMARARARARIDRRGCGRLGFAPASALRGELMIGETFADGPADGVGLEAGDLILAVAGTPVRWSRDVAAALDDVRPGDEVVVTVRRDGSEEDVTLAAGR